MPLSVCCASMPCPALPSPAAELASASSCCPSLPLLPHCCSTPLVPTPRPALPCPAADLARLLLPIFLTCPSLTPGLPPALPFPAADLARLLLPGGAAHHLVDRQRRDVGGGVGGGEDHVHRPQRAVLRLRRQEVGTGGSVGIGPTLHPQGGRLRGAGLHGQWGALSSTVGRGVGGIVYRARGRRSLSFVTAVAPCCWVQAHGQRDPRCAGPGVVGPHDDRLVGKSGHRPQPGAWAPGIRGSGGGGGAGH